ncbi:glycosyltransferase family 2 protein [Yinghuangia seranimata]|uniref:glycosyltransferase family 2 protein n=1 Tax=Yinghuangia seranimata TaxID=408067 RepID=UPI00248AD26D|nr:glycosyltransferase [Yinghuangia seranimata]MDI2131708.1 glycosyltransferase [Yinghuangia seranimata]
MPTIDIMLPYYGDVGLMQATVRSIIAQTDPDWRLTVVDDGYPDESIPGWFESLQDKRIRYFRNETNLGANRNYQKCVGMAEYDLTVIMGADDLMLPKYVAAVKAAYNAFPTVGMIQPGVQVIDGEDKPSKNLIDSTKRRLYAPKVHGRRVMGGEDLALSLLRGNWLYFPSLAWRTDAIKEVGFREGLDVVQDLALVMDLIMRGEDMVIDETVCFQYRRHAASDSSWRAMAGTRFIEERNYFVQIADEVDALGWSRAGRAARHHVSSRLHALTRLPAAAKSKHKEGVRNLSRHTFGPSKHIAE